MSTDASADDVTIPDKVSAAYRRLEAAATELNTASDDLGKHIAVLDTILKRLNLGISSWVTIAGHYDDDTEHVWAREIGYAKIGSQWGLALRTRDGDVSDPHQREEKWLFNDAPRSLRVEAVEKLPELLEALIQDASKTVQQLKDKTDRAQQVVTAITTSAVDSTLQRAGDFTEKLTTQLEATTRQLKAPSPTAKRRK